jgi:hypothetical protein
MRSLRALAVFTVLGLAPIFAGCGDDKDKKYPDAGQPSAVLEVKGGPISEIVPPASVIAWGGADDFEKLSGGAQAFLQQMLPLAPPVLDLAKDEVRRKLAFTRLEGVDWKKPARVAIFDPKKMPSASVAVVLALSSKEQFMASLPAVKKENDEGNAITYRDDLGRTICLNFIDDAVAVTWEKKQFAPNLEFFVRLAKSTVAQQQAFFLSAQNISSLYDKDIDDWVAQVKQASSAQLAAAGMQSEVGARMLSWLVTMFKELDRIEVVPQLPEDGALLSIRLHPKAGSELQKSFRAIEARPHTLVAKLPADAPMFASFSTNPDTVDGLTTRLVEWAMSVGSGDKVPEGYVQAGKDYFQATGGQVAVAAHKPFAGDGLTLTTLFTVRDEDKLRAATRKSKEVLKDKQVIETFKKNGITFDYRENAYKVGAVPVDTIDVTFAKNANPMAQLGPFSDIVKEFSVKHTAVSKDLAVVGSGGKDARSTIEAFLGGKVTGGLDKAAGPARAFRSAVKDPVGILYIAPVEMAKRAALGGKNPLAEALKDLAGTQGVALSFTARDGVFELMIDVPSEQARNIAQGLSRARALMPQ